MSSKELDEHWIPSKAPRVERLSVFIGRRELGNRGPHLDGFAADMHEPFYRDYVRDDLAAILAEAGLRVASVERCWLSKVVEARKPPR